MNLLDFLFGNMFFVVFLIWIVFAMLKNRRGRGGSTPARPQQGGSGGGMPPFGGGQTVPKPFRNASEELPQTAVPSTASAPSMEKSGEQPLIIRTKEESVPSEAKPVQRQAVKPKPEQSEPRGILDLRNPVTGMIWSEVYGPPKALRPHKMNNRPRQ